MSINSGDVVYKFSLHGLWRDVPCKHDDTIAMGGTDYINYIIVACPFVAVYALTHRYSLLMGEELHGTAPRIGLSCVHCNEY